MRAMPNLRIIRPADAKETIQAWEIAVNRDDTIGLILTRQKVPGAGGHVTTGAGSARALTF